MAKGAGCISFRCPFGRKHLVDVNPFSPVRLSKFSSCRWLKGHTMAWRLANIVVGGELDNTTFGWTIGWIQLAGREEPLRLKLHGNCHPDLAGWKFRIVCNEVRGEQDSRLDVTGLATDQAGVIGDATAEILRRHCEWPVGELAGQIDKGSLPPTTWKKALYVEWFSNLNGRVVIESTQLGVERMGVQAFELTPEQYQEQAHRNQEELDYFLEQVADALAQRQDGGDLDGRDDAN